MRVLAPATRTGAERLSRGQRVCIRHACSQQRGEGEALRRSVHCQSLLGQDVHLRVLPGRGPGAPRSHHQGALSREAVGGQGALSQSGVGLSIPGEASSLRRETSLREPSRPRPAEAPRGVRGGCPGTPAPRSEHYSHPLGREPFPDALLTCSASLRRRRLRPGPDRATWRVWRGPAQGRRPGETLKVPGRPPWEPRGPTLGERSQAEGR